jgi:hypothetical protein
MVGLIFGFDFGFRNREAGRVPDNTKKLRCETQLQSEQKK